MAVCVMAAFHSGSAVGTATAMTMAFATLTLTRLLHGFSCRGQASLLRLGLGSNPYSLAAFGAGVLLLGAVLFLPGLGGLFQVAALTARQLGQVCLLALAPTLLIQLKRIIQGK